MPDRDTSAGVEHPPPLSRTVQPLDDDDIPVIDTDRALYEEYRLFLDQPPSEHPDDEQALVDELVRLEQVPRFALCLSGGGIRSAAFCMGAMRALAMNGLLTRFHYLSMVSGGGYIGSWLLRVAHERRMAKQGGLTPPHNGPAAEWLEQAADVLGKSQDRPEVKNLREFTDFLAPKSGLLSGDIGANTVLYLRNLIATWIIIVPAMLAIVLFPVLYRNLICAIAAHTPGVIGGAGLWCAAAILALGLLALGWSTYNVCLSIPSHGHDLGRQMWRNGWWRGLASVLRRMAGLGVRQVAPEAPPSEDPGAGSSFVGRSTIGIHRNVILPSLIWAFAIPVVIGATSQPPEAIMGFHLETTAAQLGRRITERMQDEWPMLQICVAAAPAVVMFVAFLAAWIKVESRTRKHAEVFCSNWLSWLAGCVMSGLILFMAFRAADYARAEEIAVFGPLAVVIGLVLQTTFYLALRQHALRSELDREWHARVNARLLGWTAVYSVLTACALLPVYWLQAKGVGLGAIIAWIGAPAAVTGYSVGGIITRKVSAWVGAKEGAAVSLGITRWDVMLAVAAVTFAALTIVLLSSFGQWLVRLAGHDWFDWEAWPAASMLTALLILCSGSLAWALGRRININRFSMHAVYRNRLVRAFLGSARETRHPDSFVRFDAEDNVRLTDLLPQARQPHSPQSWAEQSPPDPADRANTVGPVRLFPVFGVTLNLAGGARTDWSERKAAPFTLSPLHCGSAELNHAEVAAKLAMLAKRRMKLGSQLVRGGWGGNRALSGAYARTSTYGGAGKLTGADDDRETGLTLGTAMALSGAAVSPNMGAKTSPATAFLGTLFDLRLGMWLPNPARAPLPRWNPRTRSWTGSDSVLAAARRFLNEGKPGNALRALYWELQGRTDETKESVYLSDGGHFDNLGLYEMLRRRCRCIVVIDAGYDPGYGYEDLGTTLRRASIDLEVKVDFTSPLKVGDGDLPNEGRHATITYLARTEIVDGEERCVRPEATGDLLFIKPYLPPGLPVEVLAYHACNRSFPHDVTANQAFTESQFESYRRLGEHVTLAAVGQARELLEKACAPA